MKNPLSHTTITCLLPCLAILMTFFSCTEVRFEQPQPGNVRNEMENPVEIQGTYKTEEKDYRLTIDKTTYRVKCRKGDDPDIFFGLSDTVRLRKDEDLFILNWKTENTWRLFAMRPDPGKLTIFAFFLSENSDTSLVKQISGFRIIEKEQDHLIIIDPSKQEWEQLKKDTALFILTEVFYKTR